jgi:release factor glutamine methyltransferase
MVAATTWRQLADAAAARLGSALEARRLVERASGAEGSAYFTELDEPVSSRAEPFFRAMLERRVAGEPLQYVLGRWGFRRLDLTVDRRVLIPRPETEQVVEVALAELRALGIEQPVVVDLGTGSGAIALSIAVEAKSSRVWATDRSDDALCVARANLAGIGTFAARRVRLMQGDWFDALPDELVGRVHLVVANPPYVADAEVLPGEVVDWEPAGALRSGPTGLEDVARILHDAPVWLTRPGVAVLEIAPHQAADARRFAEDAGATTADVFPDLAGRPRALVGRWAS